MLWSLQTFLPWEKGICGHQGAGPNGLGQRVLEALVWWGQREKRPYKWRCKEAEPACFIAELLGLSTCPLKGEEYLGSLRPENESYEVVRLSGCSDTTVPWKERWHWPWNSFEAYVAAAGKAVSLSRGRLPVLPSFCVGPGQ